MVGGGFYRHAFMAETTFLVSLSEAHSESSKWTTNFEKEARRTLRKVFNNGEWRAPLKQYLLDTFSAKKGIA